MTATKTNRQCGCGAICACAGKGAGKGYGAGLGEEGKRRKCIAVERVVLDTILLLLVLCQDPFYTGYFAVVSLAVGYFAVDAGADADICCDPLGSFRVDCGMAIVDCLRDFGPGAFYEWNLLFVSCGEATCGIVGSPMLVPYPLHLYVGLALNVRFFGYSLHLCRMREGLWLLARRYVYVPCKLIRTERESSDTLPLLRRPRHGSDETE